MNTRGMELTSGRKLPGKIYIYIALALFWCLPARAATITAATCLQTDVQAAINSASTGDTVIVPGPCAPTWSSFVTIASSQGITVDGGGNVALSSTSQGFNISQGSATTRVTGFICNRGSNIPTDFNGHCFQISGNTGSAPFRIDHWTFCGNGGGCSGQSIFISLSGNGPGLIDHCTFTGGSASEMIHNYGRGASNTAGWADDVTPGGPNMLFVEDSTFTVAGNPPSAVGSVIQGYYGSRTVFRQNVLSQMSLIDMHGTCGNIGARWWEVYNNTWNFSIVANQYAYIGMRDGSGVVFNNHVTNAGRNQGTGNIIFRQDCTSISYPQAYQVGRGINEDYSPAYAWGNDAAMPYAAQGPGVSLGVDVLVSALQPPLLVRCEQAADSGTINGAIGTCTTTYSYTPYTYPHPLQSGGGASGPPAPTGVQVVVQ